MSRAAIEPATLAAALIQRPSVTPNDEGAIEIVAAALEKLGFDCHRLRFGDIHNLYARRGTSRPNLCFAGHTDVRERDFGGSISLLITGDEEGDAVNGTRRVLDWLKERGEAIDACLVGEPTSAVQLGDMIKIGRRGSMTGRLMVNGVQGHTAYPHLADNAAHRIVAMLYALTGAELDRGSEHFQPSSLQVSTIDIGNPASNVIPPAARAVFNIRFNDCWTGAKLEHWVRERLDEIGGRYSLDIAIGGESFLVAPGTLTDLLAEAIRRVTGRTPELSTTGGTSDARFIQAHCPVAEFGLVGQTMHKVDERVELSDLAALTAIYHTFLELFFDHHS